MIFLFNDHNNKTMNTTEYQLESNKPQESLTVGA